MDADDIIWLINGYISGQCIAFFTLFLLIGISRGANMDRLKEKLAQASGVAARAEAQIEAEADNLIAREAEINKRTKQAFAPHHSFIDSQSKDLDHLEDALQIVSNAPLSSSAPSSPAQDLNVWLAANKISLEQHNAAIAAGHAAESRYYFEFIEKMKADGK